MADAPAAAAPIKAGAGACASRRQHGIRGPYDVGLACLGSFQVIASKQLPSKQLGQEVS